MDFLNWKRVTLENNFGIVCKVRFAGSFCVIGNFCIVNNVWIVISLYLTDWVVPKKSLTDILYFFCVAHHPSNIFPSHEIAGNVINKVNSGWKSVLLLLQENNGH